MKISVNVSKIARVAEIAAYSGIILYIVRRLYHKFKAMKSGDLELYLEGNSTGIVANRRSDTPTDGN